MDSNYDKIATRQGGLVTPAQLAALGWTDKRIRHAVATGRLFRVRKGVLRTAGVRPTQHLAWHAAVLAAGDGAVLSHTTAAHLWGMTRAAPRGGVDVLVSRRNRPRLPGVTGHRTDSLPDSHRAVHLGIPVTSAERTLVDVCGLLSPRALRFAVSDGLRRGTVRLPRLARTVDEVPRSGRRKMLPMIETLQHYIPGFDPGDSDPEVDIVELLVNAGFERPDQQVEVEAEGRHHKIDVAWPHIKVGFEYDSVDFHVFKFHEDRARLRRLKRAGWEVWPVTSETTSNEILAIATLAFGRETAPGGRRLAESG